MSHFIQFVIFAKSIRFNIFRRRFFYSVRKSFLTVETLNLKLNNVKMANNLRLVADNGTLKDDLESWIRI